MPSFIVFLFIYIFLSVIVTFKFCVIYVSEDNDSNALAMFTRLLWITWTSISAAPKMAIKLTHSRTRSLARSLSASDVTLNDIDKDSRIKPQ